jgi:hypothetical protein
VLPAVVAAQRALGHSDEALVWMSHLLVYPTGIQLTLTVELEDEWGELDAFDRRARRHDRADDDGLHFGLAFADGSKATNAEPGMSSRDDPSPALRMMGGGGSGNRYGRSFWLWRLPPAGPVEVVFEWRAAGMAMSRHELDAEAIVAAAGRAETIFPDDGEGW